MAKKTLEDRLKANEKHKAYYAIPENDARRRAALALKKQDPKWQARALESARRFRNSFTEEEWREYVRYAAEKYYDKRRKKKK